MEWYCPTEHLNEPKWEQVEFEVRQNMPVVDVQSVAPHLQSVPAVLVVSPFTKAQVEMGRTVHVLDFVTQYIPVFDVHTLVSH